MMDTSLPWRALASHCDQSVNHVVSTADGGMIECRYVQRRTDYFIIYVSSHTGCNLSCRFCHLTASKQVMMTPVDVEGYVAQVCQVLRTYEHRAQQGLSAPQRVHINFMSRGEALANPSMLHNSKNVFQAMERAVHVVLPDVEVNFLVSSILPKSFAQPLQNVLTHPRSYLYYSLYSMQPMFRKRWLPKAHDPHHALDLCADYQQKTEQRIALHWALIRDQNDTLEHAQEIVQAVKDRELKVKFNLVRYNPFDQKSEETSEERIEELFSFLRQSFGDNDSRVVPRVGFDVKASCGMFLSTQDPIGEA